MKEVCDVCGKEVVQRKEWLSDTAITKEDGDKKSLMCRDCYLKEYSESYKEPVGVIPFKTDERDLDVRDNLYSFTRELVGLQFKYGFFIDCGEENAACIRLANKKILAVLSSKLEINNFCV